jgi:CxC2 like cysteine cluster associated with KDZ transposases
MIQLEAPPADRKCTLCKSASGAYRCKDCFQQAFYCTSCCLSAHDRLPFHRIQHFNGQFFERYDLNQLGLVVDIRTHIGECVPTSGSGGTAPGSHSHLYDDSESDWEDDDATADWNRSDDVRATRTSTTSKVLTIVTSTGIFKRSTRWCTCANVPDPHIQLLRARLFPATFISPSTVFTFEVLDHFRLDALECNTAAMNFMSKLIRITNEVFPSTVPVSQLS